MHHPVFLTEIVAMFGVALVAAWLFRAFRAPSILAFLITGIIVGPPGFAIVTQESVSQFAELGLVLLLFIIGLELSPKPLLRMGKSLFTTSFLQIGSTTLATMAVVRLALDGSWMTALIVGVAVSLSSTAIVLKVLSDEGEIDTLRGRITTGILLIQDVVVIVFMLFLPLFAAGGGASGTSSLLRFGLGMAGLIAVIVLGRKILPLILEHMVRPGGPEFTTLFAFVMAFGGAALAGLVGWSLALGACVAGLLLAAADERHQIVADVLPFRDIFNAMFFISLGMLVDVNVVVDHAAFIVLAVAATIVMKCLLTYFSARLGGWPMRPALQAGFGLCTVSEFGYVLAREADGLGLLDAGVMDTLTAYALGTMAAGALLMPHTEALTNQVLRMLPGRRETETSIEENERAGRQGHIIVVGYGINGHNLASVFQATHLPYCIIDVNHRLLQEAMNSGADVIVGDATRMSILNEAGLRSARALVIAINDSGATRRVVARARDARPDMYILARTRFVHDLEKLYEDGANLVIPEEFETSIEIAAHILKEMDVPDNIVEGQVAVIRAGGYGMLRGKPVDRTGAAELMKVLQSTITRTHFVVSDSPPVGKTLAELNLRAATGTTIIAIVRDGDPTANPAASFVIEAEDLLVLVGAHAQLEEAKAYLSAPTETTKS